MNDDEDEDGLPPDILERYESLERAEASLRERREAFLRSLAELDDRMGDRILEGIQRDEAELKAARLALAAEVREHFGLDEYG